MHIIPSMLLLLTATLAGATVLPGSLQLAQSFSHIANELSHTSLGNCSLANASLPLNDTKSVLPDPSSPLTLKYIALGRGTQNYSCPSTNASSRNTTTPKATGAAATLFDASCIASASMTLLHELPAVAGRTTLGSLAFMAEILSSTTNSSDLIIGEHYFNAAGEPFFDLKLSRDDTWMVATKKTSVSAPARAYTSKTESKDVAWLRLERKEGNGIKVSSNTRP